MANPVIGLFLEDVAHERFVTSVVEKVAEDAGISVTCEIRNAAGGAPRMLAGLRRFLRQYGTAGYAPYDLLIVVQDTDCKGEGAVKRGVNSALQKAGYLGKIIVAAPGPHIEIWYLADPNAVQAVSGSDRLAPIPSGECEKDIYKDRLLSEFRDKPLGGIESAASIVSAMNMYRAGRNVRSLGNFVQELRGALATFADAPP